MAFKPSRCGFCATGGSMLTISFCMHSMTLSQTTRGSSPLQLHIACETHKIRDLSWLSLQMTMVQLLLCPFCSFRVACADSLPASPSKPSCPASFPAPAMSSQPCPPSAATSNGESSAAAWAKTGIADAGFFLGLPAGLFFTALCSNGFSFVSSPSMQLLGTSNFML